MKKTLLILLTLVSLFAKPIGAVTEVNKDKFLLMLSGEWISRAIYVAAKLDVAEHLKDEPRSCEELAELTEADASSLYRLLRMLSGFNIFEETSPGVFANSEMSCLLAKSNPNTLYDLVIWYGEEIHTALDALLPSIQEGTTAFSKVYEQPVFNYMQENPSRFMLFQRAMREKSLSAMKSILAIYDFSQVQTIYDIGGGDGSFIQLALATYPHLQGALFELPEVIAKVSHIQNERFQLIPGSFFGSVPAGADLYFMKSVLHDWNDAECEHILRNCHQAMKSESRLLIVDMVLQPKDLSIYANCMDLLMMAITGGKERKLESFKILLEKSGFEIKQVYPISTGLSIIEAQKI